MKNGGREELNKMLSKVGDLGFRRRVVKLLDYLDISEGDRVLDCGCGEGFYTMVISELYDVQVTAFDFNAALLEKAASWIGDKKRIRFVNGDMKERLPFDDGYFDKIIFTEVLEHLDDDAGALKEIYRVLKPGGIAALSVPNGKYPFFWDPLNWTRQHLGLGHFNARNTVLGGVWSYDHKRLYRPEKIEELSSKTGFKVVEVHNLTSYCVPFNYHILRLGKIFSSKLPVPRSVRKSMEKFEWREDGGKKRGFDPMMAALKVFEWVDSKNDNLNGSLKTPSVSISLKLEK